MWSDIEEIINIGEAGKRRPWVRFAMVIVARIIRVLHVYFEQWSQPL
jgi:hypothetical protein